ncbi:MAG: hypothetical protein GY953_31785, partial [bacterium]|nr:hypothetical protein [bacterium]
GSSVTGDLFVHPVAPALFSANANGAGPAAAVVEYIRGDGSRSAQLTFECSAGVGQCAAVPIGLGTAAGEAYLSLYGTGIRGHAGLIEVRVRIGGTEAEVLYAGPQGEFPGLDQVNVHIPKSLTGRGTMTISLTVAGKNANPVTVNIG